jgi:hypothetical protein
MNIDQADIKHDQEILIFISLILINISKYEIAKRKFNQMMPVKNQIISITNYMQGCPRRNL